MKKLLLIFPIYFLFISTGCNLPPSGEPHSGPNGLFSRSEYMLGTTAGGASVFFINSGSHEIEIYGVKDSYSITNRYIANIYGPKYPDQRCQTRGSYSYNPKTYVITLHPPENILGSCPDVDDPSPAGKWEYKGNYIVSPTGKKFYYRKFSDRWQ